MAASSGWLLGSGAGRWLGYVSNVLKRVVPAANGPAPQQHIRNLYCNHGRTSALWAKAEPGGPAHQERIPEYIPQRRAKNPMKVIGLAWAIGFPSGILLFLFAKREVDKKRLRQLKVRQRMKASNEGEYESGRYRKVPLDEAKP
ncbi:probable hydrolase PNKD isoform X2 [Pleurodeles waltl]|uniref:probable hydrolase PNKD isoform X2 n=1 Tax=Pleurodeles waltl TaxID=8319 RepID=UPI0037096B4D